MVMNIIANEIAWIHDILVDYGYLATYFIVYIYYSFL